MVGPCSQCGPFSQYCGHQGNSYSTTVFWPPMQYEGSDYYMSSPPSFASSSSSPSVDCTLSLGTPSTRLTNAADYSHHHYESSQKQTTTPHRNSVSSFSWDLLSTNKGGASKSNRNSNGSGNANHHNAASGGGGGGGDSLLARRCANCDTTSTPLWRNGPRGPKSLCNACGIRFKKEERRAAAATTTAANNGSSAGMMDPHHGYYNGSWAHHQYAQAAPQKMQCYGAPNEFRFMEDDRGSDSGIQFLSWLTHDRSSGLVHDFTR